MAAYVVDFLTFVIPLASYVIAGNSLGGEVAWRVAALDPARASGLCIVDGSGYKRNEGQDKMDLSKLPMAWQLARIRGLGSVIKYVCPTFLVAQGVRSAYANPNLVSPVLVERYKAMTISEGNREAIIQRMQVWSEDEGVLRVEGVSAPTLVMWGALDTFIPVAHATRFAADIPGARVVVFPKLAHVPHEEAPEETAAAFLAFLQGAEVAAAAAARAHRAGPPALQLHSRL